MCERKGVSMVSPITSNYVSPSLMSSNGIVPRKDAPKDFYSLDELIRERRKKKQLEEFDRFMTGIENEVKDVFQRSGTVNTSKPSEK